MKAFVQGWAPAVLGVLALNVFEPGSPDWSYWGRWVGLLLLAAALITAREFD